MYKLNSIEIILCSLGCHSLYVFSFIYAKPLKMLSVFFISNLKFFRFSIYPFFVLLNNYIDKWILVLSAQLQVMNEYC